MDICLRAAISIHAPRTGSDGISRARRCAILPFQSTLPARGATSPVRSQCSDTLFQSTLPARGATSGWATTRRERSDFNPRSPHGERHGDAVQGLQPYKFQSTLPARGATRRHCTDGLTPANFNPRSPHGERPGHARQNGGTKVFQSTLPARGATHHNWEG